MGDKGHLTAADIEYLRGRVDSEVRKMREARNPQIAAIHQELADRYQRLLAVGERWIPEAVVEDNVSAQE